MSSYILPEKLHGDVHYALVMGSGFARTIDGLAVDLLENAPPGEQADFVMGVIAISRHLTTILQEAAEQLDPTHLQELFGDAAPSAKTEASQNVIGFPKPSREEMSHD